MSLGNYVPLEKFGGDHWSVFGYAETVMVECAGFQVGFDPRMRQGRRHYRVMQEQCRQPARPSRATIGVVMDNKHSTILHDGSTVTGHDDWHCIQDMVNAGLMGVIDPSVSDGIDCDPERIEPGVKLALSERGHEVATQLRKHKMAGMKWSSFVPEIV